VTVRARWLPLDGKSRLLGLCSMILPLQLVNQSWHSNVKYLLMQARVD
jgi:hypothetical protein